MRVELGVLTPRRGEESCEASNRAGPSVLAREFGGTLRGRGHLLGLVLPSEAAVQIQTQAFEQGLLVNAPRPNVLRFMPSLLVTRSEIDEMTDILRRVWAGASTAA